MRRDIGSPQQRSSQFVLRGGLLRLSLLLVLLLSSAVSAQEIEDFHKRGGWRFLTQFVGEGDPQEKDLLRSLFYPKMQPLVRTRLEALQGDIEWRDRAKRKKEIDPTILLKLETLSKGAGPAAALAALSVGDYFWARTKLGADFKRGSAFYGNAIRAVEDAPAYYERVVETVVSRTLTPPWADEHEAYGIYGNFLPAELLGSVLPKVHSQSLLEQIRYLRARSLAQEGAEEEDVCEAYKGALQTKKERALRAQVLFDFAQYVSLIQRCGVSADALLKDLKREFPSSPFAAKAERLLQFAQDGGWNLSVSNKRTGAAETVELRGPTGRTAQVKIEELGLVTEDELDRRKVAQGSWIKNEEEVFRRFTAPVHAVVDKQLPAGPIRETKSLPAGPYSIELVGRKERRYLLISDLLLLVRPEGEKLKLLSVSLKTGTALPDVDLEVHRRFPAGLSSERRKEKLKTDVTGSAEIRRPKKLCAKGIECESEEVVLIARKFRHTAFMTATEQNIRWPFQGDPSFWVVLSSETPRPGEILSWNLFVRPDLLKRFQGGKVAVELLHPKGFKVQLPAPPLDPFGRAGGVVKISRNWTPGNFTINYTLQSGVTSEAVSEPVGFELVPD